MFRLLLLLFVSFGILQAAQQSPPPFDETVSSTYCSQQYQNLPNKMGSENHPTEYYEAARLLKKSSKNNDGSCACLTVGAVAAALISMVGGFVTAWLFYSCTFS